MSGVDTLYCPHVCPRMNSLNNWLQLKKHLSNSMMITITIKIFMIVPWRKWWRRYRRSSGEDAGFRIVRKNLADCRRRSHTSVHSGSHCSFYLVRITSEPGGEESLSSLLAQTRPEHRDWLADGIPNQILGLLTVFRNPRGKRVNSTVCIFRSSCTVVRVLFLYRILWLAIWNLAIIIVILGESGSQPWPPFQT